MNEKFIYSQLTHGKSASREYKSWHGMKQRCLNPNNIGYRYYGGRGVTICERWMRFENFYADMGDRPPLTTLDRKDNEKGYNKENCRWATQEEQANNKKSSRYIEFNGERKTIAQWSKDTGIGPTCIRMRIKNGLPIERVFIPPKPRKSPTKKDQVR